MKWLGPSLRPTTAAARAPAATNRATTAPAEAAGTQANSPPEVCASQSSSCSSFGSAASNVTHSARKRQLAWVPPGAITAST